MNFKFDLQLFGGLFGGGDSGGSTPEVKSPVSSAPASVQTSTADMETARSKIKAARRRVFNRDTTNVSGGALGNSNAASTAAGIAKKLLGE